MGEAQREQKISEGQEPSYPQDLRPEKTLAEGLAGVQEIFFDSLAIYEPTKRD